MKRLPYGISDFELLREKGYLYVDKTKYIELLEEDAPYQFFIRPRRFGKSLFLSMLQNYYALLKKDRFEELFGELYIGKNPTAERNSYLILNLSFASVVTSEGKSRFIASFDDNVISQVRDFLVYYGSIFKDTTIPEGITGAEMALRYVVNRTKQANMRLFLMIDEYDNFANDLIGAGNKGLYYDLLSSQGYVRTFYKAVKDGTTRGIARVFMTGVSPVMLDDLTSGFNITKNLTLNPKYNEMLGFTEDELCSIIDVLDLKDQFDEAELLNDMRTYYDGYLFTDNRGKRLYNPNMVLYFLDTLTASGKYPENMLDLNVRTDYKKLEELVFSFEDGGILERLVTEGEVKTVLVEKFNLEYGHRRKENLISLLYY